MHFNKLVITMDFVWVLIPLAAILVGALKEWLKFKEKQLQLGESTSELGTTVIDLQTENEKLTERVRNLEAIVTSQAWDALHESDPPLQLDEPDEPSDAERAKTLAQRIR